MPQSRRKTSKKCEPASSKRSKEFSTASSVFISLFNSFRFMPVHIYAVYQVQEIHMRKGEWATDSLSCLCRQMASKAGRESTSKEDVLQEIFRNGNGTVSAKKDKPL